FEYIASRQMDSVLETLQKSIAADPNQILPRRMYAFWLTSLQRPDEAINALREILKIAPNDPESNSRFGALLLQEKRYTEAVPYLEIAAKSDPDSQIQLGTAYLQSGQTEKGTAVLEKMLEGKPTAGAWNNVAYELADANVALPKALDYAQRAVEDEE